MGFLAYVGILFGLVFSTTFLAVFLVYVLRKIEESDTGNEVRAIDRELLGKSFKHGRRIDLSLAENGMIRNSEKFRGQMRILTMTRLQVDGGLKRRTVQKAVDRLQMRHPVLRCCVEHHSFMRNRYQLRENENITIPVDKHVADHFDGSDDGWKNVWQKIALVPLKMGDALIRVDLVKYGDNQDVVDLLLSTEHGISDGLSNSELAHELLHLVAEELDGTAPQDASKENRLRWQAPMEMLCSRGEGFWLWQVLTFLMQGIETLTATKTPSTLVPKKSKRRSNRKNSFALVQSYDDFTEEETTKLLQVARQNKTSVTAAVSVALLDAIAEVCNLADGTKHKQRKVVTQVAADLRRQYPTPIEGSHLFLHAACVAPVSLTSDGSLSGKDLWHEARRVRKRLIASSSRGDARGSAHALGTILHLEEFIPASPATLTSWGVLPFEKKYGDKIRVLSHRPCVNSINSKMIMAICTTVHGKTCIGFTANAAHADQSILDALTDRVRTKLMNMIDV